MKVLRLGDESGAGAPVELHPQITVVRDADPARRAWLVDVLGRIAGGRSLPATGELEAHGIRFDLGDEALALLGFDREVAAVVQAADLPGFDADAAEATTRLHRAQSRRDDLGRRLEANRAALTAAVRERDQAAADLGEVHRGEGAAREAMAAAAAERSRLEFALQGGREERTQREQELLDAAAEREAAVEERSRLRTRLDAAQNHRRIAVAKATQAAAALEEARSVVAAGDGPMAALEQARAHLAAAERAAAEVDPDLDDSPLNRRLAALERRRVELARLEAAMGDGGSEGVAEALDALLGASSDAPPLVAALALADTWRDLHQQISALEAGVSDAERRAEQDLAVARQAVLEAEAERNQPVLTPEQISKVEASHVAVLETQGRAEGRFGTTRARKRLEDLKADERRILERLGFTSYADYMMSSSDRATVPANGAGLESARERLAQAERELLALPGAGDRVRRRIELLQRRDLVTPRVTDLLGHEPTGPEAEDELRSLREPVAGDAAALAVLAERLVAVGLDVGPAPHERDELVLLARAYLTEERSAEAQRTDVAKALAALDTAVDDLRAARARGETEVPALTPLPDLAEPVVLGPDGADESAARTLREARWAEVEAARAAVERADADLLALGDARTVVSQRELALAAASQAESEAAGAVERAEAELQVGSEARIEFAGRRIAELESAAEAARASEQELVAAIAAAQGRTGAEEVLAEVQQRVAVTEATLTEVAAAEQAIANELAGAEAELAEARAAHEQAQAALDAVDRGALVDDIDWELLSRLAAVRSVGPGGSVPLVLDDPFTALDDDEVTGVLDRLAAIAGAVQVVVLSDREAVSSWAARCGSERVGVVDAA